MRTTGELARPLAYVAVFALALALNQYFGYVGYMPLDQSIVYNGAWRILHGQTPYVDFWTPFGLLPMVVQAAIFRVFGVTWTNYVLQASVSNAVFACCVLFAGIRLKLGLLLATMYAAIAAVISYPPVGTPYPDTHAALLSSLLILVVLLGILEPDRRRIWWAFAPPLAILAFLSKQTPPLYVVPFCGIATAVVVWLQRRPADLLSMAVSAVLCSLVTLLAFRSLGVTWEMFRMQTIDSARAIALDRIGLSEAHDDALLAILSVLRTLVSRVRSVLLVRIDHLPVFLLSGGLVLVAAGAAIRVRKFDAMVLSAFSAAAFAIFVVFSGLTFNQPATALPLLAIVLPLLHAAFVRCNANRRLSLVLGALPVVIAALMQYGWTATRYVNDLDPSTLAQTSDAAEISPQLSHLRWMTPPNHPGEREPDKFRQLVLELRKRSHPAVIFSDSIMDALVDWNPVAPAVFWHKKLSYPADGRARAIFDEQFKRRILEAGSDLLVVDGPQTFMATRYGEFPWLAGCLRIDQSRAIGRFSLIPLDLSCVRSLPQERVLP